MAMTLRLHRGFNEMKTPEEDESSTLPAVAASSSLLFQTYKESAVA
jgi:hypothetical protein